MREKIYQDDWKYDIVKPWVGFNVRHSYRKCQIHGQENVPTEGAVLIAPNHCNTLLDALVILRAYEKPTVFGARADIFKKDLIAKFMYFARILPMVRQRDGLRNVLKNKDTQEVIIETLENGVRFCMFPEGTHRPKHSLQTLGKGVFRAALAANEKFGAEKPVYIVPAGLEYGDYFRYRSTSLVNFGKPINVTEFVKNLDLDNEAQIMDALRKELSARMSELFTYFAFDENYEEKWALTKMIAIKDRKKAYGEFGTDLYEDMLSNREIAADIERSMEEHPEEMADILAEVKEFEKRRKKCGISIYSFKKKSSPVMSVIGKGLAALIGLPYFIFSAVSNLPLCMTSLLLRSKVRDKAFGNTASFGVKLGMTTALFPILAALAFIFAPWWLALTLLLLWIPGYSYFHDYIEASRRWFSDIKLLRERKLWKSFKGIVKKYQNL
jgi:1-acyl-sn-glycerol-3-phosphate acyltransferase